MSKKLRQYDIDSWIDRITNLRELIITEQMEEIRVCYNFRELVELTIMLLDLKDAINKLGGK